MSSPRETSSPPRRLGPAPAPTGLSVADAVVLAALAGLVYAGVRLAFAAPAAVSGPDIHLSPAALPWYALLSVTRMAAAYVLSLTFSLGYGLVAARNLNARRYLLPLLDVLQSVPILSFLPVAVLGLAAIFPSRLAAELASVILIFTSQAWNMTFSFYQSVATVPHELREATAVFRFNPWLRFRTLELPFAAIGLIWNSMMSWSGGWFFLMASEMFQVGSRDFRLPGLGSYLQTAANRGDLSALAWGLGTLIAIVALLDRLVWRPLLAWAERYKLETVEREVRPRSSGLLARSHLVQAAAERIGPPLAARLDRYFDSLRDRHPELLDPSPRKPRSSPWRRLAVALVVAGIAWGAVLAVQTLATLSAADWGRLGVGILATAARVALAFLIGLAWTLPLGIAVGSSQRLAAFLQPVVQIAAAVPATALFPVLLLGLLHFPFGLEIASVLLMLMGTQWYLLFNIIAGTSAIPVDLRYTASMLRLSPWQKQKVLVLPALFPFLITGAIASTGGAWNASVVAEHAEFAGQSRTLPGVGGLIASATASGNFALLLGGSLTLIATVVLINRLVWQPLYRLAERKYRLE